MLDGPYGVVVNERNEIAVTETGNHRVQVFSSDGTYLRTSPKESNILGNENFQPPANFACSWALRRDAQIPVCPF